MAAMRKPAAVLIALAAIPTVLGVLALGPEPAVAPRVKTTLRDFYGPGTQPLPWGTYSELIAAFDCMWCHSDYSESQEQYTRWAASSMGQGARDPIFWAAMAVAEQSVPHVSDFCIRCHAPVSWIQSARDGTGALVKPGPDEGISCSVCHRMVDPAYKPGVNPEIDKPIVDALDQRPPSTHNAQYVIDLRHRPRGPYQSPPIPDQHQKVAAPFGRDPRMCATCHEAGNPLFVRQSDGHYALGELDQPHPTHEPADEFPLERTWSEWSRSVFAKGPVEMNGRFGGDRTAVSTCQDCHMPAISGMAAFARLGGSTHKDLSQHDFRGAITWMLQAVQNLSENTDTGMTPESLADAIARNQQMLRDASDMVLIPQDGQLRVRIINQTGHKLPTGQLDGRRMWLNVCFFDAAGKLIQERGAYDLQTGKLDPTGTKVYQTVLGVDEGMAAVLGIPPGPSPFFALNNRFIQDNRIPPRGFTNAGFEQVQAAPVGCVYRDGQYWDDSVYPIPAGTTHVSARLYYQTVTKEAVEAMRDANHTNNAGQLLYQQWELIGKTAISEMDRQNLDLASYCRADFNGDRKLSAEDVRAFRDALGVQDPRADFNDDGVIDDRDTTAFLNAFAAGCSDRCPGP